jgi:hypothetical protein
MFFPSGSAITWDPIEEISIDKRIEYQRYPAVAADGGKAYAVWADNGDKDYDIMFREHDGAAWQLEEEVNVDDRDIDQFVPDVAADGGTAHVVWHDPTNGDYDIMYRKKSGAVWGPLEEMSSDVATEIQQNPVVAASGGKVYVAWQDGREGDWDIYFRYHDGVAWGSVQEVNIDAGTEAQTLPAIAAGGGRAYVVWENAAGGADKDILLRVFDGASWGTILEVSQDSSGEVQNVPDVAYDAGKVHVVWEEFRTTDRDIYYRSWDGSSFSSIQEISVDSGTEFQDMPAVAAEFGKVHTVWVDRGDGDWDIVYRQHDGSSWLAPQEISADTGSENQWYPDIAADGGVVHVVWEDQGDGDNDIFYRRGSEGIPIDTTPPDILDVFLNGSTMQTYPLSMLPPTLSLTATLDDSARGASVIGGANYTTGQDNWATSTPMTPDDFLDSIVEGFHATLASPTTAGTWDYCVYGWDVVPNYNITGLCATLTVDDDLPPIVTNVLLDGLSILTIPAGTPSATLTAIVDDSTTGGSIIAGANYTSPAQDWLNSSAMIQDDALDTETEGFHATIDTSQLGFGSYEICAYGWDVVPNYDTTGSCATLNVAVDTQPPIVTNVLINGMATATYGISSIPLLTLTATVDDSATGDSVIGGANYTIGPQNWATTSPMTPDSLLDSSVEGFHANLVTPTTTGSWQYCVYGWDEVPNYGTLGSCATLTITDDLPPEVLNVLIDGFASKTIMEGTVSVQLTATVDDSAVGGSVIGGANYTIGAGNFPGVDMNPANPPLDSEVEDFASVVPTGGLTSSVYQICVYGWDVVPNHNTIGSCATLTVAIETEPPVIANVLINSMSLASYGLSSIPPLTLAATVDDSTTGGSIIAGANYTIGPQNWPTSSPMDSDDVLDSSIEGFHTTLAQPSASGTWQFCVYGWDVIPNHNTTGMCATLTIYDDMAPEVQSVLLDGGTSRTILVGTANVLLTATLDDSTMGGSIIGGANYTSPSQDWSNSTAMTPEDFLDTPSEGFYATIDTSTLGPGTYEICVYGWDEVLNNNTAGSCATLIVATEIEPPMVTNVLINGLSPATYGISSIPVLMLTATVDDSVTGGSVIGGANYTVGPQNWPTASPMTPDDLLDSSVEGFHATLTSPGAPGTWQYCVYGWDEVPNYNTVGSCATLTIFDDLPPDVQNVLLDGVASRAIVEGTASVTLTATIDDTLTGNSVIGGANHTSPAATWSNSTSMNPSNPPLDTSVEAFTATIDTQDLSMGTYEIWVYGWDAQDNFNLAPSTHATLTVTSGVPSDRPPTIDSLTVEPPQVKEGEEVEIVVVASDDGTIDEVWIEVDGANGSDPLNISAEYDDSLGGYIARITGYDPGEYSVTAWVGDDGGNWVWGDEEFEVLESIAVPEVNYKPVLAVIFTILLLIIGFVALRTSEDKSKVKKFWFLPFALEEAITALVSGLTGALSIPPVLGPGLLVDSVILLVGLSMPLLLLLQRFFPSKEGPGEVENDIKEGKDPENTK